MVRVRFLILVSTLFLSACATDQQGSDSLAQDLLDCIPNPTVVDLWACAAKKHGSPAAPAFETRTVERSAL